MNQPNQQHQPLAVESRSALPNRRPFQVGDRVRYDRHDARMVVETVTGVIEDVAPSAMPGALIAWILRDVPLEEDGKVRTKAMVYLTEDGTATEYSHDTLTLEPARPEWEADDITGPVSRVVLTHPILGRLTSEAHPSPASAHAHAELLRTDLAGQGWTVEVTA